MEIPFRRYFVKPSLRRPRWILITFAVIVYVALVSFYALATFMQQVYIADSAHAIHEDYLEEVTEWRRPNEMPPVWASGGVYDVYMIREGMLTHGCYDVTIRQYRPDGGTQPILHQRLIKLECRIVDAFIPPLQLLGLFSALVLALHLRRRPVS